MNPDHLPRHKDDLGGLRAARWIRESSAGQGDKYGPGAQRTMQDKSIERHGLVDTGLSWTVLKSGWSGRDSMDDPPATRTADFQAMLRAAEDGLYDVLLVGYSSRFLRDLTLSLYYRRFFHRNGVVILICDDRILTSDPDDWERYVEKLKADELYSRTQSRNVRTGYAEKRASVGDPGGQPSYGYRRENRLLVVDEPAMAVVRTAFELSAAGKPDLDVASALGLGVHTVRHVLTNPIYLGVLRDGSPFRLGPAIETTTWNLVQQRREARRTRVPGPGNRRCYALKLTCGGCGAALQGHNKRYRHAEPACAVFTEAQPEVAPVRGRHAATAGTSYPSAWYEAIVGDLLGRLSLTDEGAVQQVIDEIAAARAIPVDQLVLSRIARARDEAMRRLARDQDTAAWSATWKRLEAEEAAVRSAAERPPGISEVAIRAYLANLGSLWTTTDDMGRQGIATALFDELAVTGFQRLDYTWSATAKSYGIDRLVPAEIIVDLGAVGLVGGPQGDYLLRSQGPASAPLRAIRSA